MCPFFELMNFKNSCFDENDEVNILLFMVKRLLVKAKTGDTYLAEINNEF